MASKLVDARGAYCPGPLMALIAELRLCQIGDSVEVLSSDQGSASDIPAWIAKVRHELVSVEERDEVWHIIVKKLK